MFTGARSPVAPFLLVLAPLVLGCGASSEPDASSGTSAALLAHLAPSYEGTIADFSVMVRLQASGNAVTGSLFYVGRPSKGEVITLKGTLSGSHVALDEIVLGRKTASFDGALGSGRLEGTRRDADGSLAEPFMLTAVAPGEPFGVMRVISDEAPAVESSGVLEGCAVEARYLEMFGLADGQAEADVNRALAVAPIEKNAEGKCPVAEDSLVDQAITLNHSGLLAVEEYSEWFAGGAHTLHRLVWKNFSLGSGRRLLASEVFRADAVEAVKQLVVHGMKARDDVPKEDLFFLIDALELALQQEGGLDNVEFRVTKEGILVSVYRWLPYVVQPLDESGTLLRWSEVRTLLDPTSPVAGFAGSR